MVEILINDDISGRSKESASQGMRTNPLVYKTNGRQGCGGYPLESPEYGRGDLLHKVEYDFVQDQAREDP